jgi:hypothetical protein
MTDRSGCGLAELTVLQVVGELSGGWIMAGGIAASLGLAPKTLRDCFIDVDGELLLERLRELALTAAKLDAPISFQ